MSIKNVLTTPISELHPVLKVLSFVWISMLITIIVCFLLISMNIITIGIGGSMSPTYGHCSVVGLEPTTINTVEEGDTVRIERDSGTTIIHRVHTKYDSYNPDNATHHITYNGKFWNGNFALYSPHDQYDDVELENKTVIVTKGDNNSIVDPELFTKENLKQKATWSYSLPNSVCPF